MISSSHAELTRQLGVDLDSPVSWLHYPTSGTSAKTGAPKPYFSFLDRESSRDLESNDRDADYLVDEEGNSYEPYSLAWRYLGMFVDCEKEDDDDDNDGDEKERRRLSSDDGGNNSCARKVLWAAVSL